VGTFKTYKRIQMSPAFLSSDALRKRVQYALHRKQHYCYLIHIECDSVAKLGRTSRLEYRLKNLNQSIYRPHKVYTIHCNSAQESLMLERYMKRTMQNHHIKGEWYTGLTPESIQSMLIYPDWGHLLLQSYKSEEHVIPRTHKPSTFTVSLN
jgi:hypothetical protein